MAIFKVHDRVRIVAAKPSNYSHMNGLEGVIVGAGRLDWEYEVDFGREVMGAWALAQRFGFDGDELAPLSDPHADAFIERVKRWKPEPEILPLREDELERVQGPGR